MQSNTANVTNMQMQDSSSKIIFDEPVLCAQFLRDYSNIPMLKNVQPEDIEDVSERFVHLFSEERNADTVKRVRLENQVPFFMVSLIEHKTYVDYNVGMQILRYMVYIWEDYEKEMDKLHEKDKTVKTKKQKDFRYPVILPIVYYEGKREWTAPREFKERIWLQEEFAQYIPNFAYELIQLKDYSNETLLAHKDEISLIMMFNKLQDLEDIDEIKRIEPQDIEAIVSKTPEYLLEIVVRVIRAFLFKMNLPMEEAEDVVGKIKERRMGYLFENMEKLDIQLERRLRKEAEEVLAQAQEEFKIKTEIMERKKEELDREKEELGREKEEIGREKEEIGREKEEIGREKEEIGREKEEIGREKEEIGREKEEIGREKEEIDREKEEIDQEKEELDRKAEDLEQKHHQFVVHICKMVGMAKNDACNHLTEELQMAADEAEKIVNAYWDEQ
ncbi:MAG: Rpn family recombination-promoting nuclease/putative transposase [Lachnospiraceae bacterium]|nr:Rpn family recombination-promoting nuclease/putative transposase [Lachnospiraceae bacterium]